MKLSEQEILQSLMKWWTRVSAAASLIVHDTHSKHHWCHTVSEELSTNSPTMRPHIHTIMKPRVQMTLVALAGRPSSELDRASIRRP
ncbi:MAG: hypothetical protein ABSF95_23600 [Verrucomicrobiota bacterium]|jgi:hypothetical protein